MIQEDVPKFIPPVSPNTLLDAFHVRGINSNAS